MNLKDDNLEIVYTPGPRHQIRWLGKSESRDPSVLINPYFKNILTLIKDGEVEIHFEELKYMNSSTVPPIIQLIKDLEANGIKTFITYNKNAKWQTASFKALETIVRTMKHITVSGI